MAGENDTEMHAILAEYELPYRFEEEVEAGRRGHRRPDHGRGDYAARRDFRETVTFTVDPADAKDFDDALSVRKVRDGVWESGRAHRRRHALRPPALDDRRPRP